MDALVAALQQWAVPGVSDNPGAWLVTTAKRPGIDYVCRAETARRQLVELPQAQGGMSRRAPSARGG